MNETLEVLTIDPPGNVNATIIWLHGLGASGSDLMPVAQSLSFPSNVSIRHIFPHAPTRPVTLNNYIPMSAWYDIPANVLIGHEDEAGIKQSANAIVDLIAAERKRGLNCDQIILAGFSQGGAMALYVGLTYPQSLAGIVALSSVIPLAKQQPFAKAANLKMPIFMAAGINDPLVQFPWTLASQELLTKYGFSQISWHTYPMEHQICPEEISDLNSWLAAVLA